MGTQRAIKAAAPAPPPAPSESEQIAKLRRQYAYDQIESEGDAGALYEGHLAFDEVIDSRLGGRARSI